MVTHCTSFQTGSKINVHLITKSGSCGMKTRSYFCDTHRHFLRSHKVKICESLDVPTRPCSVHWLLFNNGTEGCLGPRLHTSGAKLPEVRGDFCHDDTQGRRDGGCQNRNTQKILMQHRQTKRPCGAATTRRSNPWQTWSEKCLRTRQPGGK